MGKLQTICDIVCVDAPHPLAPGFSWWYLKPGERSFTATTFEGWDQTVEFAQAAWREQGPFDGLLGFSQGAILIAGLELSGSILEPRPTCAILFGAATPGPFRTQLSSAEVGKLGGGMRSLHVIGKLDDVNPPDQAHKIATAFGGEVYEHEGGHDVPMDHDALRRYASFLCT